MEKFIYRFTLDAHKNGIQKTLQGFETKEGFGREIEVSLVENSKTYNISDNVVALLYIEGDSQPKKCEIEEDKITYVFLPGEITTEGTYNCQIKLIEISANGAESVLLAPRFAIEAWATLADDYGAIHSSGFNALEDAIAKAEATFKARMTSFEFSDDFILTVKYGLTEEGMQIEYVTDIFTNAIKEMHPTIRVGTVTEGDEVAVENVGTDINAVLNFTLAKGTPGPQGPQGIPGAEGVAIQHGETRHDGIKLIIDLDEDYPSSGGGEGGGLTPADVEDIVATYVTNHKDELKGDRGPKGEQGNDGSNYEITTADYDAIADVVIRRLPQSESEVY